MDPSSCADAPRGLLLWLRRTERQVASPAYGMGATPGPLRRTGPPGSECRGQYGTATRAAGVCRSETRGPRADDADTKGCLKPLSRPLQAVATLADTPRPSRPEVGYDPWVGEAVQPLACSPLQPHFGRSRLLCPTPSGNPRDQRVKAVQRRATPPRRRCLLWPTRRQQTIPSHPP